MSNEFISAIRANVATQLGEVTQLQQVINSRTGIFSAYPACRFFLSGIQNDLVSNAPRYLRKYQFTIEIIQEMANTARATAESLMEDAVEAVLNKLGTEWTLDNNAATTLVSGGTIVEVEIEGSVACVATIIFEVHVFTETH
jgi:hypothetical protein